MSSEKVPRMSVDGGWRKYF